MRRDGIGEGGGHITAAESGDGRGLPACTGAKGRSWVLFWGGGGREGDAPVVNNPAKLDSYKATRELETS